MPPPIGPATEAEGPHPAASTGLPPRLESVDLVRGIAMALMVLDHVRDYFGGARYSPVDLSETYPALFLTRWVTHPCAPAFVLLAGTGVYLAARRGKSRSKLSRSLLIRGMLLIALELTVVRFAVSFNLDYRFTPLGVLWCIGWSMIALAGLIWLPMSVIAALGAASIAGHNLLDGIEAGAFGRLDWLWMILHEQGRIRPVEGMSFSVIYPLIPWVGVMAVGYCLGSVFGLGPARRRRVLLAWGMGLIGAFLVLRAINVYGDPSPWSVQGSVLYTVFSFLNCKKYPPSLLFLLMTMGPTILALAALDRGVGSIGNPLIALGRVPLFFYLLQWPLIHALAVVVALITGQPYEWLFASRPFQPPSDYGYGLPTIYLVWAAALLVLYPACRWFGDLKRRRRDAWLGYF